MAEKGRSIMLKPTMKQSPAIGLLALQFSSSNRRIHVHAGINRKQIFFLWINGSW